MTEENKAVIHMRNMGLFHIQCEFPLAFKECSTRFAHCLGVLSSSFDNDHKIIRVPAVGGGNRNQSVVGGRHHTQYAQPTEPALSGVTLLEHVWNAVPEEVAVGACLSSAARGNEPKRR